MANTFNRNDGTFAAVGYADLSGTAPASVNPIALITSYTAATSATIDDTTSLTTAYSAYDLVFENLVPATNNVTALLFYHSSTSFQGANYLSAALVFTAAAVAEVGNTGFVLLSNSAQVQGPIGLSGTVRIYNPGSTTNKKLVSGQTSYVTNTGSAIVGTLLSATWNGGTTAVDGFRFQFNTGNIASGTLSVYGVT